MEEQPAAIQTKLGNKPASMQPPSKGEGKGARRGGRSSWDADDDLTCPCDRVLLRPRLVRPSAEASLRRPDKTKTKSNGRLAVEGAGQNPADFSEACTEAAWYSQPSAVTDHHAAERTQKWAWTSGTRHCRNPKGLTLIAVWVA
eukprot:4171877-Amphidinium_carterae.1